ncbi:hypothetical protein ABKN59_006850 [Abortiporus biennis]
MVIIQHGVLFSDTPHASPQSSHHGRITICNNLSLHNRDQEILDLQISQRLNATLQLATFRQRRPCTGTSGRDFICCWSAYETLIFLQHCRRTFDNK